MSNFELIQICLESWLQKPAGGSSGADSSFQCSNFIWIFFIENTLYEQNDNGCDKNSVHDENLERH